MLNGEQLQQQEKQMQQEQMEKDTKEEPKASNDHNSAEQENAKGKSDLEEKPTTEFVPIPVDFVQVKDDMLL
jgi:hypothetical protein